MRNLLMAPLVRYLTMPHDPAPAVREYMRSLGAIGQWNLAFKFAFVRDPYTWVESMRRHAIAQHDHPLRVKALDVAGWPSVLARACARRMETTDGELCFQRDMVLDNDGDPILDRLCRFENYAHEVMWILDHLGIERPETIPHVGIHAVPTHEIGGEYREGIAEHFAEDFEALNYEP